ncbi:hypothetical protein NCS56_00179800 [Fusarium sp. Ph1]|nr:hypothetical protein NCS56_00179800 [Fusarium sp. Ph1]
MQGLAKMTTSIQSSSLVILDSSAYEWNEEFISGRPQTYDSQNIPYVVGRSEITSSHVPTTADELIDCFLTVLDDRDVPHGPSTYQYLDIRALCAGCNMKTVEDGLEDNVKRPVALLDDRSRLANKQLAVAGYRRSNPGILNASQLLVELKKARYNCHGQPDAERRLLYVMNPDCWIIMVLLSTASPEQALYLTEFLYKYLGSKTSLSIHRPPRGVLSFALEFHLQFYVWREEDILRQDPRKKKNKPLRRSFRLNYIDEERPEGISRVCIYEAQISCLVAGLDNHSWMAYLFIDTYYQEDSSSESVEYYHSQEDLRTDPLAAGTVDSDLPIWTPREYFLVVYECRLKQVKHALQNLVSRLLLKLEPYIQDSMTLVPRPTDDGFSPAQKKKIQQMLNEASRVLRQTIHSICKSVEVWDRFSSRDAAYLSDILRPRSSRPDPIPPFRVVARIGEHIDGLRDLQRLAEQQQELCAGLARELEMELVMEDNEITVQQQATGELLKTLTAISVLFLPLMATAALFSMQPGVLPPSFYTGKSFLLCWLLPTFVAVVAGVYYNRKSFRLTRSRRGASLQDHIYSLQMRGRYTESARSLLSRGADISYMDDIELGPVSRVASFLD